MNPIEWLSEKDFKLDGVNFHCALDDYSLTTNDDRVIILKDKAVLENYRSVFSENPPGSMLEFGIFQGGSPAFFSLWLGLEKFVGIDLSDPVPGFDAFCKRHPVGKRISTHYNVSQTDKDRIDCIIQKEFENTSLDVVVDDASHLYKHSRRTFEIAFPQLRPGGTYVVEDWGWAHWPGSIAFMGETALSILIMELTMLCASRPDLVSEIRVFPSFTFIRKSPHAPAMTDIKLESLYNKRGLEIVGADGTNLMGLRNLFSHRLRNRASQELRRFKRRTGWPPSR